MDLGLAGKRALVTGASRGIGKAIAAELAREGCSLVLVARHKPSLDQLAESLASTSRVETVALDLSVHTNIETLAGAVGEIDILVNNAGSVPPGNLVSVDNEAWRGAWDLKVFGYISLSRCLLPMLRARRGVIVNIIGSAAEALPPNYIAGASGNAALVAFTRALARGVAADGMRVVGVSPGPVATERLEMLMRAQAAERWGDEERWREPLETMPHGRVATPQEIAAAVAFLASPRSGYTSGTVLTIDGGGS
jgi:NAD(P)-dependent dehydrogenase (short-subunit alcohol dehydrogenase family)